MNGNTINVTFGRSRLPRRLAEQLLALPRGIRGRTIGFILLGHTSGLELRRLVEATVELRRLGVLMNQSLRVSRGTLSDPEALALAVKQIKELYP